jgi:hypothetical protein
VDGTDSPLPRRGTDLRGGSRPTADTRGCTGA